MDKIQNRLVKKKKKWVSLFVAKVKFVFHFVLNRRKRWRKIVLDERYFLFLPSFTFLMTRIPKTDRSGDFVVHPKTCSFLLSFDWISCLTIHYSSSQRTALSSTRLLPSLTLTIRICESESEYESPSPEFMRCFCASQSIACFLFTSSYTHYEYSFTRSHISLQSVIVFSYLTVNESDFHEKRERVSCLR